MEKVRIKKTVGAAAVGLLLAGCSNNEPEVVVAPEIDLSRSEVAVNAGINAFGLDFFNAASSSEQLVRMYPNFAVSPVSIGMAMSICANTYDEDFATRICEALGCEDKDALNELNAKLMAFLPAKGNKCEMTLANSVWHDEIISPVSAYEERISEYYSGKVNSIDFSSTTAAEAINRWVADNTGGLIKNVVNRDDLENAVLLQANAMYFTADWDKPFDSSETKESVFHGIDGDSNADFMHATRVLRYYACDEFEAVTLPYSGPYELIAVLPGEDVSYEEFSRSFSSEKLESIVEFKDSKEVDLSLPKFKSESKIECNDIFATLGIDIDVESLEGFNPVIDDSVLLKILHVANVSADEKGTVAAAVTVVINDTLSPGFERVSLRFDHPFIYLIRCTTTGSVIVVGRYAQA